MPSRDRDTVKDDEAHRSARTTRRWLIAFVIVEAMVIGGALYSTSAR